MKWFDELKNSYNGWSRTTRFIAIGAGVVLLWSTGLFPFIILAYLVWMGKKWWDNRNVQNTPSQFQGTTAPTTPPPPAGQPIVAPPTSMPQSPPVSPSATPPPPPPSRPVIDWNKP